MFNLNVGILGHVDSGKTSLAIVLSKIASTAAFDKNPQSKERGITLDLGFSSFTVQVPKHLLNDLKTEEIQFTLVDCPGHASLIRTIIGGAQIIDMMLLVIDITKGIQIQTAECLVIGELTCKKMIIVVNKLDQIPIAKQKHTIEKMTKKLKTTLAPTYFKDAPLVFIAANPVDGNNALGIQDLIDTMLNASFIPCRDKNKPFLCAVDHCFGIRGQGTVLTGTILQGSIRIHDEVQIPLLNISKKVKSIQMFRKPIEEAEQGDRVGICVTQFDSKLFERGIIAAPGLAVYATGAIIIAQKIEYFNLPIKTKSKFHVTVGHETVMASITCFSVPKINFDQSNQFNFDLEYKYCKDMDADEDNPEVQVTHFILLEFEKPVLSVPNSLLIGSKLDMDIHSPMCRLAFWGTLLEIIKDKNYKSSFLPNLKIFKMKKKLGVVDRLVNENEVIVKNMFKKKTNIEQFVGLNVSLPTGDVGTIKSQFGQSGKLNVHFQKPLNVDIVNQLQNTIKKSNKDHVGEDACKIVTVVLEFKKYIYDVHKKIIQ